MTKLWKLISAAVLACVPLCASAQYPPGGPADIAGTFYASNFAGWTIAQGNNGPFAWSSSAVCLKASSGGVGFQPFVVGSPIRIVDTASPSHSENVTVTAVRVNGSGCAITTTTPTYQHLSFYLTSATGGLQEAINFSKQNYGVSPSLGVAIATADWERLGGTTAMIVGAAGGSNVSILDLRTSCPVAYTWNGSVYVGINLCNGGGGGTTTLTLTTTGTSGPSTLTGDPTVGYALNVPNYATGGGSGPELQVNGVDTFSQTLLDLDQGPNITITNTSGGHVLISGLPGASIMPQVVPPIAGQYAVLYPSTGTLTNDEGPGRSTINSTSGNFVWTCSGIFCTIAPLTTANWSGFALPSSINPANVTAIYADVITSAQSQLGRMPFSGANGTSFICGVGGSPQLLPSNVGSPWVATEVTQLLSIPATSIASLTCPITLGASGSGDSGETINVSAIRLIVYYTGTAQPVDSRVQIVPPLVFNADLNQLSIDPLGVGYLQPLTVLTLPAAAASSGRIFQITDGTSSSDCTTGGGSTPNLCRSTGTAWTIFSSGGGGGGGLSGQTTGYLPLATSATASTTSSALQDTGSSLVYHGTGTQHGLSFGASSGGLITPVAGSAGLGTDASGLWNAYENGGTWSRLCTVGNALCTGSVGVSSIDTQTGAFTFSGAGVSHVGNAYTFSGGGSAGAWSALTNPTANLSLSMGSDLTTFSFPGVFTNTQMNQPFKFLGNSINLQTEFQTEQGGIGVNNTTESASFGLAVPSTSTVYQSSALSAYTNNASTSTNAVAAYFSARSLASGVPIWAINPLFDDGGFNTIGFANETDCNVSNTSTQGPCQLIDGLPVAGNNFGAIDVTTGNANAWKYAYKTENGKALTAISIGTLGGVTSNSQPIVMNATLALTNYAETLSAVPGGFLMQAPSNGVGNPALEVDTNDVTASGQFGIKAVQNLTGTSVQGSFLGQGYCPYQGWKDGTPTEAFSLCYGVEGSLGGNDPTFAFYNGTSWASAWFVSASTGKTNFQTGVVLPVTGSTQCLHADTSGNVTGTGSDCGAGSSAFSALTGSTNTTAAMLVGSGASLAPTGTGTIQATNIASTIAVSAPITVTGTGSTASPYTIACPTCGTSTGGTSVSQNSGAAEVNLPITGYMPQVCSDVSASGTAQSCTVANSFTPQAGNCLVYKTTTANSGTGLTVNINSLGAKSVAVPGSSGWTTTLVASSSIPANKPMNLCYDGTNWNASGTGFAASSGGSSFPLTFVQESTMYAGGSSFTVTFPQAAAASGDTLFMLVATDGGGGATLPTGWTVDINQVQAGNARFVLLQKASASDTSATISTANAGSISVEFFEVTGTHTLDQFSVGGAAGTPATVNFPAIIPTAGSVVFAAACLVQSNASGVVVNPAVPAPSLNAAWGPILVQGNSANQRALVGYAGRVAASHVSTQPPQLNLTGYPLFSTGGVAYATFSIL